MGFAERSGISIIVLLLAALNYFFISHKWQRFSTNPAANELAGNGLYDFGAAFLNNELDYYKFYKSLPDEKAFALLRQQLSAPNATFTSNDVFSIERDIRYNEPEQRKNVVLISIESLSGDFMAAFGNKNNITPTLDSLAQHSLFFTRLYATGTRTVRGLESLSMAIAPTPGQSMVKRPDNGNMFTLGSVFAGKGYTTQYIYGGYSYFDNMKAYFGSNGYEVIDRDAIPEKEVHYANIWGVCDEDLFTLALRTMDKDAVSGQPFFTHIMTVSNHRPFTYPEGKIDIPPGMQSREGGVKYTDYAIGQFIREASTKPWFANTVFVIVADHCASSAGKTELPVNKYHIPLLIYAPGFVQPQRINRLVSQIDVAPTLLGLLKMNYRSKFFGQDIFQIPPSRDRAFISTYQSLGYLRDSTLTILSPVMNLKQFHPDFNSGSATPAPPNDSLQQQAIAWHQCASWLLKHKKYTR
jgi:phosphoglycerol transferase MdoB-like AlkP superfamily enzyme